MLTSAVSFFVTETFSISPSALFQIQSAAQEIVIGAAFGYHFGEDNYYRRVTGNRNGAYLGAWYRVGDAIIFMAGIDYSSFKFGFSYDINVSDLNNATNGQGAIELSMMYTGKLAECRKSSPVYCPRF